MVGVKLTREPTGRGSSWSTDDLSDPRNQVHQLTDLLDRLWRSGRDAPVLSLTDLVSVSSEAVRGLLEEVERVPKSGLRGELYRGRPDRGPKRRRRSLHPLNSAGTDSTAPGSVRSTYPEVPASSRPNSPKAGHQSRGSGFRRSRPRTDWSRWFRWLPSTPRTTRGCISC